MSNVTPTQKRIFVDFATKYEPRILPILNKGNDTEVIIESVAEAQALDTFAGKIVSLVLHDYPDYAGKDEDINDDAVLIANVISKLIGKFEKTHPN